MTIVIAGAGSIGTVLGILLQKQGQEVYLLRRNPPFGLNQIEMFGTEKHTLKMNIVKMSDIQEINPEIIIITTQAQHVEEIASNLREIGIGNGVILVSMQNGITGPTRLCSVFPNNPILQCSVWWSATLYSPTNVLYHRKAVSVLGIPTCSQATTTQLESVFSILNNVLSINTDSYIASEFHKKLVLNVVSPVLSLVKLPYPDGLKNHVIRNWVHHLFDEALFVADQLKWNVEDKRLDGFHRVLAGIDPIPEGPDRGDTPHKVSTQIGVEKYGGLGSNADELLGLFIDHGAIGIKNIRDLVVDLDKNYEPIEIAYLGRIYDMLDDISCNLSENKGKASDF